MTSKRSLTINFFGGSYGHFVHAFLTGNMKKESINLNENNFHDTNKESSVLDINIINTHDDEKISDELNLKITYKIEHIDLIVRNVYEKTKNLLEKNVNELFSEGELNISNNHKQIITIAFYKNALLHGLAKWNKILKKSTIELPLDYFFTADKKEWLDCWKNIFVQLKIDVIDEYITDAFDIFKITQQYLIAEQNFYNNLKWKEQDIIGKGNMLGEAYYYKHSKDTVPIDIVKYKDTRHMLSTWIENLNNGMYVKL